ncbi:MAG: 30S ribosomal protein S12 methylthiotransferase RimO [Planctomycetota bacterium]|nr:MAG: 30S ribosomal protein S12 methylthiotransferase RimO [Planctomycetota bacterium]
MPHKFYIRVLGCAKNLIDAENLCGRLAERGWLLTDDPYEAEMLILATCAFIAPAREEAARVYRQLARIRRETSAPLVLTGCHPPYFGQKCASVFADADCILPTWRCDEFATLAERLLAGERYDLTSPPPDQPPDDDHRLLLTPPHTAYIRISDGCSNTCTFCTIPRIRGRHRPKTAEQILAEASALAALGAKEIILIAQDTTAWQCPKTRMRLPSLLEKLDAINGICWVRLMYAHPARITRRLVRTMLSCRKIIPYIDVPIQHISDEVLSRMGRAGGKKAVIRAVELLKSIPQICVRTTVMVGFPGETEAQFEELIEFLRQVRFCRVGIFAYSAEEGTKAAGLEQLPKDVVRRRLARIRRVTSALTLSLHRKLLGKKEKVLVDWVENGVSVCRTYRDAPEVDGVVYVAGELEVGGFAEVCFDEARAASIIAHPVERQK